jgi:iron complex transport system ATP-binding protein
VADPNGASLVTLERATHSYDGLRRQFEDLSLTLRAGEVTAILGPNGRGKSTLLRVIAGLRRPTAGAVRTRGSVGLVPQDFARAFPYAVVDIVLMGRARHVGLLNMPTPRDRAIALSALERVGVGDLAGRDFDTLSGGERQMVLIARAVAGEHAVLLLDEPASALDLKNQDRVLSLIRSLADEGPAVAFTTHQPNHAHAAADTVLLMPALGAARFGPRAEILTDEALTTVYGLPVRTLVFRDVEGRTRRSVAPLFTPVME